MEEILAYPPVAECISFWLCGPYGPGAMELRLTCRAGRDAVPKLPPAKYENLQALLEAGAQLCDRGMVLRAMHESERNSISLDSTVVFMHSAFNEDESMCCLAHQWKGGNVDWSCAGSTAATVGGHNGPCRAVDHLVKTQLGDRFGALRTQCICNRYFKAVDGSTALDWLLTFAAIKGNERMCHLAKEWGATKFEWMMSSGASSGCEVICRLAKDWGAVCFTLMSVHASATGHLDLSNLARKWMDEPAQ